MENISRNSVFLSPTFVTPFRHLLSSNLSQSHLHQVWRAQKVKLRQGRTVVVSVLVSKALLRETMQNKFITFRGNRFDCLFHFASTWTHSPLFRSTLLHCIVLGSFVTCLIFFPVFHQACFLFNTLARFLPAVTVTRHFTLNPNRTMSRQDGYRQDRKLKVYYIVVGSRSTCLPYLFQVLKPFPKLQKAWGKALTLQISDNQ